MFSKTALLALAAASAAQASTPQGFNYGSTMNGQPRTEADFESDFKGAQQLQGTNGAFNSARLYTMIDGINTDPSTHYLSALDAAATTKTQLLLGLWMSGTGQDDEIKALKTALNNKALVDSLSSLVLGISVGSEDLYRISPTGLAAPDAAPGSGPDLIVKYIKEVREAIAGTPWAHVPVGHVDTWTAWVNGSNSDVITNSDFLGVDAYPYWQNTEANSVSNGKSLFNEAMDNTKGVSQGKPVWITETGWAVSGPTEGQAEPGIAQAQQYYDEVACPNLGNTPTFWYTLYDGVANMSGPKTTPSFSVASQDMTPLFDLSCKGVSTDNSTSSSSSSSSSASSSATATGSSTATGTGSSSTASSAANGTYTGSPSHPSASAGSSSSGPGTSTSGSGSGSASSSSSAHSSTASISTTNGASSLTYSFGSMIAVAAAVAAFL